MTTTIVTPTTPTTTSTDVPDDNTYLVTPGSTLTVAGELGPDSVITDVGGTVLFETPPGGVDSGLVTVLDQGNLVFAGLQFIDPATVTAAAGGDHESIRIDETSILGIANTPPGLAGAPTTTFDWVTNLGAAYPPDPSAGSFNIQFAGQPQSSLDVGLLGSPALSSPDWSFSQPVSSTGIFSPTDTVMMGVPSTPNASV